MTAPHFADYVRTHHKAKGEARATAILDATALYSAELASTLRGLKGSVGTKKFIAEVIQAAPRNPELCAASVAAVGGAKAKREIAEPLLRALDTEALVDAARLWIGGYPVGAKDCIRSMDAIASWCDPDTAVRLYRLLECHGKRDARDHALSELQKRDASPEHPWSAWKVNDDGKAELLRLGFPSSADGEPRLTMSGDYSITVSGKLPIYRAAWGGASEHGYEFAREEHHDASLVFDNVNAPTVFLVDEGKRTTIGPLHEFWQRRATFNRIVSSDMSPVRVRIFARGSLRDPVATEVAKVLGSTREEALGLVEPPAPKAPLGRLERERADALIAAVRMAGGRAHAMPPDPMLRVEVFGDVSPAKLAVALKRGAGLDGAAALQVAKRAPGPVLETTSREQALACALAIRDAGIDAKLETDSPE